MLMRRPDIAMSVKSQRRITYELVFLEWVTLGLLFLMARVGKKLRGSGINTHLVCKDQPIEVNEMPEWRVSLGTQIYTCMVILIQIFIITELIMYIILFKDLFDHNNELKNRKLSGLSAENLQKRQRKNVITLSGQGLTFVIEFVMSVVFHFVVQIDFYPSYISQFIQILLVFSHIVTSPELRRFYFNRE